MYNRLVTMEVLTSNGNAVTEYKHNGETYIEGRKGSEYTIRLRNNSAQKVLAVLSVDGLDVIKGQEANFDSSGYVLGPYETYDIKGWRTDNNSIRKFFFADKFYESYSKKTGHGTQNTGVIGLAVFTEKVIRPYFNDIYFPDITYTCDSWGAGNTLNMVAKGIGATASYSASTESLSTGSVRTKSATRRINMDENVATGMGRKETSKVSTAYFNREDSPSQVMQIQYRTRKELERIGIRVHTRTDTRPNAFPAQTGYCQEV